jgi:uncharacterized protein (UPF0332 family)
MTTVNRALLQYRLNRARVTLEEARMMVANGFEYGGANRLYYACFYAVSALLHAQGLSAARHAGVRALFGQHVIRTGRLPKEFGDLYNDLYEARQEYDYDDFVEAVPSDNGQHLLDAARFIEAIDALISTILAEET